MRIFKKRKKAPLEAGRIEETKGGSGQLDDDVRWGGEEAGGYDAVVAENRFCSRYAYRYQERCFCWQGCIVIGEDPGKLGNERDLHLTFHAETASTLTIELARPLPAPWVKRGPAKNSGGLVSSKTLHRPISASRAPSHPPLS